MQNSSQLYQAIYRELECNNIPFIYRAWHKDSSFILATISFSLCGSVSLMGARDKKFHWILAMMITFLAFMTVYFSTTLCQTNSFKARLDTESGELQYVKSNRRESRIAFEHGLSLR